MGFEFSHRPTYPSPTVQEFPVKSGVTDLSGGVIANIESGEVDLAATNDTALAGLVLAPVNPDDDIAALPAGAKVKVITDPDAIYRVTDANARVAGATLDLATGAAGVAASSNVDVVVTATSTSAQPTHVRLSNANHFVGKV